MTDKKELDFHSYINAIAQIITVFIAMIAMDRQTKQHFDAMSAAQFQFVKSQQSAQEQFSDSQRESREQFTKTIEATFDDLRMSHDPYLQFERDGIIFIEKSQSGGWQRLGLASAMFSALDNNSLPEVENLGRGPAFQVEFDWIITAVNGKEIPRSQQSSIPPERNFRGDEGNIRIDWLPKQILTDSNRQVSSVDGVVFLKCRSLREAEVELRYSMDTKLTTHYSDKRPYVKFDFTGWKCDSCKPVSTSTPGDSFGPVKPRSSREAVARGGNQR